MPVGDEDLSTFLADFGEPIRIGLVTAQGIVDDGQDTVYEAQAGDFIGPATRIVVRADTFINLQEGATLIRVGAGISYRVMRQRRIQDGKFVEVFCAAVS